MPTLGNLSELFICDTTCIHMRQNLCVKTFSQQHKLRCTLIPLNSDDPMSQHYPSTTPPPISVCTPQGLTDRDSSNNLPPPPLPLGRCRAGM